MRRRKFIGLLAASLAAVFGTLRAAHPAAGSEFPVQRNNPKLVLHKGWILRADDPRS
jgi:hypothetical protein